MVWLLTVIIAITQFKNITEFCDLVGLASFIGNPLLSPMASLIATPFLMPMLYLAGCLGIAQTLIEAFHDISVGATNAACHLPRPFKRKPLHSGTNNPK